MTDALHHASEGHYSPEITMLENIKQFGLEAMTGRRQFYFGEFRRMITASNIVTAYQTRKQSLNWDSFRQGNPRLADLLKQAEMLAHEDK